MAKLFALLGIFVILFFSGCKNTPNPSFDPPSKAELERIERAIEEANLSRRQSITAIGEGALLPIISSLPEGDAKMGLSLASSAIIRTSSAVAGPDIVIWENFAKHILDGNIHEAVRIARSRDTEIAQFNIAFQQLESELRAARINFELDKQKMNRDFLESVEELKREHKEEIAKLKREHNEKIMESTASYLSKAGIFVLLVSGLVMVFTKGKYIIEAGLGGVFGFFLIYSAKLVSTDIFFYVISGGLILGLIGLGLFVYKAYKDKKKSEYMMISLQDAKNEAKALAEKGDDSGLKSWEFLKGHLKYNEEKYYEGVSSEIDSDLKSLKAK